MQFGVVQNLIRKKGYNLNFPLLYPVFQLSVIGNQKLEEAVGLQL